MNDVGSPIDDVREILDALWHRCDHFSPNSGYCTTKDPRTCAHTIWMRTVWKPGRMLTCSCPCHADKEGK